ncbi:MAG: hypothetical protein WD770_09635 [Actinomycetota bacterium]
MSQPARPVRNRVSAVLAMAGAFVTVAATFLPWYAGDVLLVRPAPGREGDGTASGIELTLGLVVLIVALVLLVLGFADSRGAARGRWLAAVTLGVSLLLCAGSGYAALTPESAVTRVEGARISNFLGVDAGRFKDVLVRGFDEGDLEVRPAIGAYLALAGAALAAAGSIWGVRAARREDPAPPSPID